MKHLHDEFKPILQQYANGVRKWQTPAVKLFKAGLLAEDGLHALKLTLRGRFALQGIYEGVWFKVTEHHHLPFLHGRTGRIENIRESTIDCDGCDEWGYVIKRAKPSITVSGMFPDEPWSTWCFYNPKDLIGFPNF